MDVNPKELKEAIEADPQGQICYRCTGPNMWCDDCGWFYVTIDRKTPNKGIWARKGFAGEIAKAESYRAICYKCWKELGCSTCER